MPLRGKIDRRQTEDLTGWSSLVPRNRRHCWDDWLVVKQQSCVPGILCLVWSYHLPPVWGLQFCRRTQKTLLCIFLWVRTRTCLKGVDFCSARQAYAQAQQEEVTHLKAVPRLRKLKCLAIQCLIWNYIWLFPLCFCILSLFWLAIVWIYTFGTQGRSRRLNKAYILQYSRSVLQSRYSAESWTVLI